ncbi:Cullin-associated NEDD8-dissociated protein 1 [Cichlidogyrus casuarinus]|uniref:Cullin-associated NEDD8-dissociated protein 1 n=1 Tax=Cichlidogyrus casuarinus TaxID=1844966 RepID=A0ABD2PXV1_9PLAT
MIEFLVLSLSSIEDAQKESVCGLGLRSVIQALEEKGSLSISDLGIDKAVTCILGIVNEHKAESVRLEACEVLSELISAFGSSLVVYHSQLLRTVLICLFSTRPALRKRAIQACCGLSWSMENQLFSHLYEFLLLKVESCCRIKATPSSELITFLESMASLVSQATSLSELKTVLQCLCAISKNSTRLSLFVPRTTTACNKLLIETSSLTCFDSEPEDCDLDDDTSWKVRRACLRAIEAAIDGYPQETATLYKLVSPRLLELLASEREESVRMELCSCFSALLKHTRLTSSSASVTVSQRLGDQSSTIKLHNALSFNSLLAPSVQAELECLLQDPNSPNSQLALIMPQLYRLLFLQCAAPGTVLSDGLKRSKSLPKMTPAVRHAGILLVKDLAFAMPAQLKAFFEHVIAIVQDALCDASFSNTAKIDFANVLVLLLMTHPSSVLKPHLAKLVQVTAIGLKDPFYRVVLEALDLCQLLARSLKMLAGASFVNSLVKSLLIQVQAQDKDLELREKALSTA